MIPLSLHANAQEFDHDTRMRLADLLRGDLDLEDLMGNELDSACTTSTPLALSSIKLHTRAEVLARPDSDYRSSIHSRCRVLYPGRRGANRHPARSNSLPRQFGTV
jgi:hypothetical protein